MSDDFPLNPGDTATVAMLSPCVGGQSRYPVAAEDGTMQFDGAVIGLQPAENASESVYDDMRSPPGVWSRGTWR